MHIKGHDLVLFEKEDGNFKEDTGKKRIQRIRRNRKPEREKYRIREG